MTAARRIAAILATRVGVRERPDGTSENRANGSFLQSSDQRNHARGPARRRRLAWPRRAYERSQRAGSREETHLLARQSHRMAIGARLGRASVPQWRYDLPIELGPWTASHSSSPFWRV